jgi:hypothetical protein
MRAVMELDQLHALPRRLRALRERVEISKHDEFGDWQLARRSPLTKFYPAEEIEIVADAAQRFVPFAGSFAGGVLALDLSAENVERASVVDFDSEGGITVLGESFDDFLALLAADEADPREDAWVADDELRCWIVDAGIRPHRSAHARLTELAEKTRATWIQWTAALRDASRRLRPAEAVEHVLALGEGLGAVSLGMTREALDARWGEPRIPAWARGEKGVTAFYSGAPFTVHLDRDERRVTGVTLYAGRHQAATSDGVVPMLMLASDAMNWLAARGLGPVRSASEIRSVAAKLRLGVGTCRGGRDAKPWVKSITLSEN